MSSCKGGDFPDIVQLWRAGQPKHFLGTYPVYARVLRDPIIHRGSSGDSSNRVLMSLRGFRFPELPVVLASPPLCFIFSDVCKVSRLCRAAW